MLSATHFNFSYPGMQRRALEDISFATKRGEVLGIIGPIGAGKTTLCMSLAGFVPRLTGGHSMGDLEVAGLDPRKASGEKMARQVAMVFEDYSAQITQIKVFDEVMVPLINRGVPIAQAQVRGHELLAKVGLADHGLERKRTWELSGGQQQRLAIAATLAMDPQVLILDNVTGMLDAQGKDKVRSIITELSGETTLVVIEDHADFLILTNRILVLIDGKAIAHGPSKEILRDDQLLSRAGVEPPLPLRVIRALNIAGSPLTAEELK